MEKKTPSFVYGTAWKEEYTSRLVVKAVHAGFRAIDTANQPKHYNESQVGKAMAELAEQGITRDQLFVQTKFTPLDGQDHRVPYDRSASLDIQVHQSFQQSLENLGTDYVDCFLLHGPYSYTRMGEPDWLVWHAIEKIHQSGKARMIGISNVQTGHLKDLLEHAEIPPMIVQNRCFAMRGWDKAVRECCWENNIAYQGFSLLTANGFVLVDPAVKEIAQRLEKTPAQIVFRFAIQVGMIPLTGTASEIHMTEDLDALNFQLSPRDIANINTVKSKYR